MLAVLLLALPLTAPPAAAQNAPDRGTAPLRQFNEAIEALVHRVSPSVVQIVVTGYGATETADEGQTSLVIARQRKLGSGVIVDANGFIVTNAHVVSGAEHVQVVVPSPPPGEPIDPILGSPGQTFDARIVGEAKDMDLAVIKIEAKGLPFVSLTSPVDPRQGELVFAFGSPEGLRNSVTMGVVSAVARQPDDTSPMVYIQTDTPINPGNSGGPLVDADGHLVGINTFILTASGGNEGLGFAIPGRVVAMAYPQLVKFGHVHEPEIGLDVQPITPDLAAALGLPRDFGIMVSDVLPDGPADQAGLKIQDVIVTVDGAPVTSTPLLMHDLLLHRAGDHMKMEVLRGSQRVPLDIEVTERPHAVDKFADMASSEQNVVKRLGILALDLKPNLAQLMPQLRINSGVIVAARTAGASSEIPLATGDVIHSVNGAPIASLDELRAALNRVKVGGAVALQIERDSRLTYLAFELD
jgi:serine protease Do